MAMAGLREGVITPEETIYDPGYYELPNDDRRYRNWLRWGHGRVDLERALEVSNNTYFYSLAHDLASIGSTTTWPVSVSASAPPMTYMAGGCLAALP